MTNLTPYQIAVVSGKGGTGKTTVAVNLFHTAGRYLQGKVQLVDCDVEEPNSGVFFPEAHLVEEESVLRQIPEINTNKCTWCRKCSEWCQFNALTILPPVQVAEVAADLCHSCNACLHACPVNAIQMISDPMGSLRRYTACNGADLIEGELMVGKPLQTPVIRKLLKYTSGFEGLSILDAPPGTSCSVVSTIKDVDLVLVVIEPTRFGLHDAGLIMDLLESLQKPFEVVINKAHLGDRQLEAFLQERKTEPLCSIPFKKEYAAAYAGGNLLAKTYPEYQHMFDRLFHRLTAKIPAI